MSQPLRRLASVLFVLAVPTFLLLTNVRVAATEPQVYEYSFSRYDAVERTGIARPELDRAAREIVDYFNSGHRPDLEIEVLVAGETEGLFNTKEILHMRDVRGLFRRVFWLQEIAFVYLIAYVAAVVIEDRRTAVDRLAIEARRAGLLTVGVLAAAAAAAVIGFHWLFHQFHELSFSNDFWKLNSATDRLIQMFPDGFWFDLTLAVGLLTLAEGALVALGGYLVLRRGSRGISGAPEPDAAAHTSA